PFDLTDQEWSSTRKLLRKARLALHDLLAPDGYLLGWNDGAGLHAHLHVIPRFDDEPLRDRWVRSAINVAENRRPNPWAPGSGRALSTSLMARSRDETESVGGQGMAPEAHARTPTGLALYL